MLANGTKLYYSETDIEATASGWIEIPDLKEIPDMGTEPELIDNTGLNDKNTQNDMGIGSVGEMTYLFKHSTGATSALKLGRKWQADDSVVYFKEVMSDGTTTKFSAKVSVRRTGGGVNGVVNTQLAMAIQSDFEYSYSS